MTAARSPPASKPPEEIFSFFLGGVVTHLNASVSSSGKRVPGRRDIADRLGELTLTADAFEGSTDGVSTFPARERISLPTGKPQLEIRAVEHAPGKSKVGRRRLPATKIPVVKTKRRSSARQVRASPFGCGHQQVYFIKCNPDIFATMCRNIRRYAVLSYQDRTKIIYVRFSRARHHKTVNMREISVGVIIG